HVDALRTGCRLIITLKACFQDLIAKQEEQTEKIHKAVEALKPQAPVTDKKTTFWNAYMKLADEYDKEFQQKYSTDLDTGLIFAGLFSAVSSAFIIQIQPALATEPPLSLIVVSQSLLYFSLFTTLLAALLAVLGKQWVIRGSIEERGLERQRKLDGLRKWKFDTLALLLFSIALTLYLWKTNLPIAIIVLALTSFGSASYVFLLDSPFQTPLAPFLVLVFSTMRRVLITAWKFTAPVRQFLAPISSALQDAIKYVCAAWSRIFKSKGYILPRSTLHSKHSNNTALDSPYPAHYFVPPSAEVPAVLWVLETSTDPSVITAAANITIDLQWPLDVDLSSSTNRLEETFYSCFMNGNYRDDLRSGMSYQANTCGMAYGSLQAVRRVSGDQMAIDLWLTDRLTQPGNIMGLINGWPLVIPHQGSVQWALHIIPSALPAGLQHIFSSREDALNYFLDQFQADTMPTLDDASYANYLCCINSFLSPVDPRLLVQIDKRNFHNQLKIQLFEALQSKIIDNSTVAKIIHTTAQLQKQVVVTQEMDDFDRAPQNLIRALSEFCCSLSREPGWLDVIVSAVTIAPSRAPPRHHMGIWEKTSETGSKLLEVDWIYLALQHVQQRWGKERKERNIRDPKKWDANSTLVVDNLLQALLFSGSPPRSPLAESLHMILCALSCPGRVSVTAFFVLHWGQSWFLDRTLQPIMQQYPVWSHLSQIVLSNGGSGFGGEFLEMGSSGSNISVWKPLIYQELPAFIAAFPGRRSDTWGYFIWNYNSTRLSQFIELIRTIWVLDWDPPCKFKDSTEESWALAIEALSNVWQNFAFLPIPFHAFIQLVECTVLLAFKVNYSDWGCGEIRLSRRLRAIFVPKLGTSLGQAAQNARNMIPDPDTAPENTNIQQIAQFLDALGNKIGTEFEETSGEVEIGGETKAYEDWRDLRKHFYTELNRLEKSEIVVEQ
ncbi:hypothetical protein B0H11DRAFT_2015129, partial [Mycena galericulata]